MADNKLSLVASLETKNFVSGVKKMQFQLKGMRKDLDKFNQNTDRLGKSLIRNVSLPLAAAGTAAVKFAADLETLETSFVSLVGGTKQAAAAVAQLNDFTAKTPFQLEAVAASARQLLAAGTGIDELNTQLQFLGDIAATTGKPINEIAAIFAKVNAKGKVELENLNQLAERGIPIFTELSKATGLLPSELGAGAVTVAEFNAVLASFSEEGGFAAGAMERLSETAEGKFSTAMDNIKLALASLGEEFLPIIKQILDKVISLAQSFAALSPSIKQTIGQIALFAISFGPILIGVRKLIGVISGAKIALAGLRVAFASTGAAAAISLGPISLVATAIAGIISYGVSRSLTKAAADLKKIEDRAKAIQEAARDQDGANLQTGILTDIDELRASLPLIDKHNNKKLSGAEQFANFRRDALRTLSKEEQDAVEEILKGIDTQGRKYVSMAELREAIDDRIRQKNREHFNAGVAETKRLAAIEAENARAAKAAADEKRRQEIADHKRKIGQLQDERSEAIKNLKAQQEADEQFRLDVGAIPATSEEKSDTLVSNAKASAELAKAGVAQAAKNATDFIKGPLKDAEVAVDKAEETLARLEARSEEGFESTEGANANAKSIKEAQKTLATAKETLGKLKAGQDEFRANELKAEEEYNKAVAEYRKELIRDTKEDMLKYQLDLGKDLVSTDGIEGKLKDFRAVFGAIMEKQNDPGTSDALKQSLGKDLDDMAEIYTNVVDAAFERFKDLGSTDTTKGLLKLDDDFKKGLIGSEEELLASKVAFLKQQYEDVLRLKAKLLESKDGNVQVLGNALPVADDFESFASQFDIKVTAPMQKVEEDYLAFSQKIGATTQGIFKEMLDGTLDFGEVLEQMIKQLVAQILSLLAAFALISAIMPGGAVAKGGFGNFLAGNFGLPTGGGGVGATVRSASASGAVTGSAANQAGMIGPRSFENNQQIEVAGVIKGSDIHLLNARGGRSRSRSN